MGEALMRISELSSRAEISVATIKFYLRENLLHEGVRTAATQAQYDESHLARLRLIRALLGPGGLSIAAAHQVIQAIEEPPDSVYELLGVAANAVAGPNLEDALRALDEAGFQLPEGALEIYTDHIRQIAQIRDRQCADRVASRGRTVRGSRHCATRTGDLGTPSSGGGRGIGSPLRLIVEDRARLTGV
jgi:DNA-binding transcriptional MerR regulator